MNTSAKCFFFITVSMHDRVNFFMSFINTWIIYVIKKIRVKVLYTTGNLLRRDNFIEDNKVKENLFK